jgi:phenylalanine-4-hydroxylase
MNITKRPYIANPVDQHGFVSYSREENKIWRALFYRQVRILKGRACDEYLRGLSLLQLPSDRIPQCYEVNQALKKQTSWTLEPVSSLIPAKEFFRLLANRKFPVATFIRHREDFGYVEEPDIFHEIVGHCPLLMHAPYADFLHCYGQLSLNAAPQIQTCLERLFFFTIETGLIKTDKGLRIYGGGILSSKNESIYALDSQVPERRPFNIYDIIQSAYGLDQMQTTYYVLESFETLYTLLETNLTSLLLNYASSN